MNKQKFLLMILIFSGIGILIMSLLMVFGSNNKDINTAELMVKANQMYNEQKYKEAIDIYNQAINNNSGSSNDINAYMALGNTYYRLGSSILEKQKMQTGQTQQAMQTQQTNDTPQLGEEMLKIYEQSLEQYRLGIEKDTNNLDIKFNYEFVKTQLDELKKEQEKNNQNQDNDKNKENQNNKDDQNQDDNQESKENNKENQNNNNDQNEDTNDQDKNEENQENPDNQQKENNQDENQKDNESDKNSQEQFKKDDNTKDKEDQGNKSEANDVDDDVNMDDEAIQQILKMLEQQEKESLKNNQAVVNHGKEETYDW